jgi:hypothetical protein
MNSVHVDHLVYGVSDLDSAARDLAERLGVEPVAGGRHVNRGTHNALLGLGGDSYLEVIAADPAQAPFSGGMPFGLDRAALPRLLGWAVRAPDIERRAVAARERGYDPGAIQAMSRMRPDGVLLEWRLTRHDADVTQGLVVPFLIDWGASPHPSASIPAGVRLVELRAEHPDPAAAAAELEALGAAIAVDAGAEPALVATLDTPRGRVVLR